MIETAIGRWERIFEDGCKVIVWSNRPHIWKVEASDPSGSIKLSSSATWKWRAKLIGYALVDKLRALGPRSGAGGGIMPWKNLR